MKTLYTPSKFKHTKCRQLLPLKCLNCEKKFYLPKWQINTILNKTTKNTGNFCSSSCHSLYYWNITVDKDKRCCEQKCNWCNKIITVMPFQVKKFKHHFCSKFCSNKFKRIHPPRLPSNRLSPQPRQTTKCNQCGKTISKHTCQIKRTKNHFCSCSCNSKWQNSHKTTGTTVSKLEKYLQEKLVNLYPNVEFLFNDRTAILSELDIYIPSLNLAFELNGIFHYEPIFGKEKLVRSQSNDNRKILACSEHNIELCVIDTTSMSYFKEKSAITFLSGIKEIIQSKIERISSTQ